MRMVAVWSVLLALVTVGFVAAAQEFSILPMPSREETKEMAPVEELKPEQVEETTEVEPTDNDGAAESMEQAEQAEVADEEATAVLPDVAPAWTEEEIRALRELAQERIAAKELMAQVSEYFKGLWDEEVAGWFDGDFSDRTGKAVEEAGELAREWLEAQRELARELADDVKELRESLRNGEDQD